jgi:hypothetical protein
VALLTDDTKDRWKLARSVLTEVPEQQPGQRNDLPPVRGVGSGGVSIPKQLTSLAEWLAEQGVEMPDGSPYTKSSLNTLRDMAMTWRPDEVHAEAAYRTHQEAGGRDSLGRKVLSALCAIARGERVRRPEGVTAEPWDAAKARVVARTHGYKVAADDVRTALERRLNNPRQNSLTVGDVAEALEANPDLAEDLAEAVAEQAPEAAAKAVLADPVAGKAVRQAVHDEEETEAEAAVDGPHGDQIWHDPNDGPYWDSIHAGSLRHAVISYGLRIEDAQGDARRSAYLVERGEASKERLSALIDVGKGMTARDLAELLKEE